MRFILKAENLFSKIKKMSKRTIETSPLLKKISILMYKSVMQNFQEQRTDKQVWKPLSPMTIAMRRKGKGKGTPKILQDTGFLKRSIFSYSDDRIASVATNIPYATIHQFGAKKGSIATNLPVKIKEHWRKIERGKKVKVKEHTRKINVPFGDIPARPFMVLRENYKDMIKKLVYQHFTGQEYGKD